MPSNDDLKKLVCAEIDRRGQEIIRVAQTILEHPEPGFREQKTARLVADQFRALNIPFREGIALTGLKGMLQGGAGPGPTVGVMGELDSLIVLGHPKADPETNAAHACGHHGQIGMLIGVAMGLGAPGVLSALSGRVALLAVPAEEYIEIEYRNELRKAGKIEFLVGKQEFIRLGELDDVDMAMLTHATSNPVDRKLSYGGTNNGMVAKWVQFVGRAAHAGARPQDGINALNAAMIALSAIHAQRETYKDEDYVRIHPIITRGGAAVSSVPADVRMETFVRGKSLEAVRDATEKVDRALRAGAMAVGGQVRVTTLPGYMPRRNDRAFEEVYRANAAALVGEDQVAVRGHGSASSDEGDVSLLMPVPQFSVGGASGIGHGADFLIHDYELGVLTAAKAMAMTVVDLLADGAAVAQRIKEQHQPAMTKAEYLALVRSFVSERTYEG
ncbi:MAG: peptidase dimerization domain-containing protein [Chloroflexi bacterium]|nr:peptidase dimerization domain-containing protein [Chloroflexota bacterium]